MLFGWQREPGRVVVADSDHGLQYWGCGWYENVQMVKGDDGIGIVGGMHKILDLVIVIVYRISWVSFCYVLLIFNFKF